MPRVISADEAKRLGAVPVGPRVMTRAEAEAAGAVPIASDVETRIASLGGVKQADGTYVVPGENGGPALRLDAEGNQLDAPVIGEESTGEAVGNRVLATAASGAQGFIPQLKGVAAAAGALGSGANVGEAYRKERDSTKATVEQARGKSGLGYDILGSVLAGGVAAPETAGARIALSAGLGAVNAASGSNVDLTKDGGGAQFAGDVALGAGIGGAAAGVGEAVGAGVRKLGGLITGNAAKAIATQTAKDAAAVEKEVASLAGKVGAETQKGSRLIENLQRGTEGLPAIEGAKELAEGVLARNRATLPGQLATIEAAEIEHAAAKAAAPEEAARRTREYFAQPLWQSEILPRLKQTLAPRFGLAAVGMVLGGGVDKLFGGDGHSGGFAGAVLGAPGMMQMLRNVAKSPRVQVAVATKLAPLLQSVANTVARGAAPVAAQLAQYTLTEAALGPPDLAAQQLIARGGLAALTNDNGINHAESLNAPQSPLDRAIQQTTGVTLLAGALHDGNESLEAQLERMLQGKPEKVRPHALGDLTAFAADPSLLVERLANNTGNLATIAPGIAAELAATTQRAADYLAKVSTTPAPAGPLAPAWVRSDAEKRSIRLATNVVAQPLSILESAAAGMLVPEQVAALNAVYPMLGRQISDMALDQLTSGPVSYRARLMVSLLTGVDADGTLASIGPNQQAIRMQSQKPSNMGTPAAGADKLTVAQRSQAHQSEEA